LVANCPWYRLDVVSGKIQLVAVRLGHKAVLAAEDASTGATESLHFSAVEFDAVSLRYQYADPHQQWLVEIENRRQVSIQRRPREGSDLAGLRFQQAENGGIRLSVDLPAGPSEVAARDLWHLLLEEPELSRQHLVPVLESLRPNWQLLGQSQQLETALVQLAASPRLREIEPIQRLVDQLADPEFPRRQAADRQLRAMGQWGAAHLDRIDTRTLSAEQRLRVERIRQSLRLATGDTPRRVAVWLIDDLSVWLALLDRNEPQTRVAAAQHLAWLTGKPIDFDPLASADERQRQGEGLRSRWGLDRPAAVQAASPSVQRR
jgi:hypothetical protein